MLFWDASALVKRYIVEAGSSITEAIWGAVGPEAMSSTYVGYAETAAILRRRLNQGQLRPARFQQARAALREEVLASTRFTLLHADRDDFLTGIGLADRHNLNATDGAVLRVFLTFMRTAVAPGDCVLVASDRRLLRAAALEGLRTLDPERVSVEELPVLPSDG